MSGEQYFISIHLDLFIDFNMNRDFDDEQINSIYYVTVEMEIICENTLSFSKDMFWIHILLSNLITYKCIFLISHF